MSERDAVRRAALERLKWMHEVAKITITEIAERLDTTQPVVSRWYNYEKTGRMPSYSTSKRILRLAEIVAVALPKVQFRQAA
jgi:DNA-binding transcriptional ArsR family regulator